MTEAELGQVKGRFRAGDEETEYNNLLDAINRVEEIAEETQREVWVREWNGVDWDEIWEVDGRIGV
ncbi:MAG: hypothetical protein L6R45_10205 [Anaerolineae bacterium]|nr:hypothetical protein [Anaerolineae bacterium]